MKKIIVLAAILLLTGVGCVNTQKQTANLFKQKEENVKTAPKNNIAERIEEEIEEIIEPNLSQTKINELNKIFTEKSQFLGYRPYYPTYIPDEVNLNEDSITISDNPDIGKILTFILGAEPNSDLPWILIQEQKNNPGNPEHVLAAGEEAVSGLNGYAFSNTTSAGEFHNAIFTTDDGIIIKITSKHFLTEDLKKIAKLMK